MPFHNPIRLAKDIATVDVISGDRFELGVGIGFKREELVGFGVSDFQNIRVTPEPGDRIYCRWDRP